MKQHHYSSIKNIVLIAAIAFGIFFAIKTGELKRELAVILDSEKTENTPAPNHHPDPRHIDSLLSQGAYRAAVTAHGFRDPASGEVPQSGEGLRMAVIAELLQERDHLKTTLESLKEAKVKDSIPATRTDKTQLRLADSLSFALEKTQVELDRLKRQLRDKSFGEYLTFRSAKGTLMHYVGEVRNGKANGFGIAILETGSRYEGQWRDNLRHGSGSFYWPDGQYYIGQYESDQRNGDGTYYWPNGEKYVGDWEDDRRNGQGAFYDEGNEVVARGTWKDDKLVEER